MIARNPASNSNSLSADSRSAPWHRAQASMAMSAAGTVTPWARARRARSYAADQTSSSIGRSGSASAKRRRTRCSRSPRAPFHNSSCTIGHQQASPDLSADSTRLRIFRSPSGLSRWIHEEVSIRVNECFPVPALLTKLSSRHQVRTGAGKFSERSNTPSLIEVRNGGNHRFPLGLCSRKADGVRKFAARNINRGFHAGILAHSVIYCSRIRNIPA